MHNLNKRFVQNGLEFVNHVATAPVCGPRCVCVVFLCVSACECVRVGLSFAVKEKKEKKGK